MDNDIRQQTLAEVPQQKLPETNKCKKGYKDKLENKSLFLTVPLSGILFWYLFTTEIENWYSYVAAFIFLLSTSFLALRLVVPLLELQEKAKNSKLQGYIKWPLYYILAVLCLAIFYGGIVLFVLLMQRLDIMNE